jgi:hypothetical protein
LIFPAPENSYTSETAYGQVIYVPRDIMKRANQRARQGYPDFRLQSNNIDLDEEPKKKLSQRGMSEAVIEGKGDKDDGDISLPMDINENSHSFLSEEKTVTEPGESMDVEIEQKSHSEEEEG